ncbi:MAG: aldehyde dehydrogenase [Actinotalea sp.]|nr:aldehyde dehydrogenase [Actinotalea sp.]
MSSDAGVRTLVSTEPASGRSLGEFEVLDAHQVQDLVDRARRAQPGWAALGPRGRRTHLRALAEAITAVADELAELDSRDCGNPVRVMLVDVHKAAEYLYYFAELGTELGGRLFSLGSGMRALASREPYGVVGVITAYNHPFYFSVVKCVAALAAGNAVVLKPPEEAPLSTLRLAELVGRTMPADVLLVATGDGSTGAALVRARGVGRISFTGSLEVGRLVLSACGEQMRVGTAETGGKNPFIVLPGVDPEAASAAAVQSLNLTSVAGQSCSSTSRVLVHASLHAAMVEQLRTRFDAITLGMPEDPSTQMGCLISMDHLLRIERAVSEAERDGATVVTGGRATEERLPSEGAFYRPTLVDGVTPGMPIARNELFGPVLVVIPWESEDELLEIANGLEYGMSANVWAADERDGRRIADALRVGTVWLNWGLVPMPVGVPFGGVGSSGTTRDHSMEELESFTVIKTIGLPDPRDPAQ